MAASRHSDRSIAAIQPDSPAGCLACGRVLAQDACYCTTSGDCPLPAASAASHGPPSRFESETVDILNPASPQEHAQLRALAIGLRSRVARPPARPHRTTWLIASLLAGLVGLGSVQVAAFLGPFNDRLNLRIENQGMIRLDLRQSSPISPQVFGVSLIPEIASHGLDQPPSRLLFDGPVIDRLLAGDFKLLSFPDGNWGKEHQLSYAQLDSYGALLLRSGAQGMIHTPLAVSGSLLDRAGVAAGWVDFMSNPRSRLREGFETPAHLAPIRYWTVGSEPDVQLNPDTRSPFRVAEYVAAFVQYSTLMHKANPAIQVVGPELSRFGGIGAGPRDADGTEWMSGFLDGVAAYERTHPNPRFRILDGISFHFDPAASIAESRSDLMANSHVWTYLLTPLRRLARQMLGRDTPIGISQLSTGASASPPAGLTTLWWADTLGALIGQEVDYAAFAPPGSAGPSRPPGTPRLTMPAGILPVFELYRHTQSRRVAVSSLRDPVSTYATEDSGRRTVSLLFLNKAGGGELAQVSSENRLFGASPWPALEIRLAPYSLTLITLHRQGDAQAYRLKLDLNDDSTAPRLINITCGSHPDWPADDIPC